MLLLKIIIFALGITFSVFGYLIVFKKYSIQKEVRAYQ